MREMLRKRLRGGGWVRGGSLVDVLVGWLVIVMRRREQEQEQQRRKEASAMPLLRRDMKYAYSIALLGVAVGRVGFREGRCSGCLVCRDPAAWKVLSVELEIFECSRLEKNGGCKKAYMSSVQASYTNILISTAIETYRWETCLEYETFVWWLSTCCGNTRP